MGPVERHRRIEAYGLYRDERGRVLLVPAEREPPDEWALPGGVVAHGEHPATTLARAFAGYGRTVEVEGIREVITDLDRPGDGGVLTHHDRLIFDVRAFDVREPGVSGALATSGADAGAWVGPEQLADVALRPFTGRALGRGGVVADLPAPPGAQTPAAQTPAAQTLAARTPVAPIPPPRRHQRFAAYGLVTDVDGRVLLTQIAVGYPGAGRWHLPGGGTDFGESAEVGFLRELIEETDQRGRITGLLSVSHRHQRDALGPERIAIDWHGVRVVFRALVERPTPPRVTEGAGSTQAAAWFEPAEALTLELTEVAHEAVAHHNAR